MDFPGRTAVLADPAMIPPSLVIFDCDGVLVDSETIANRSLVAALGDEGWGLDEAESRRLFVGLSLASVVARIEAHLGRALPPGWVERMQAATYDRFRAELIAVPGAVAAVQAVQAAGIATCVASSGSHEKLALTLGLTGLAPVFSGRVFSATEVRRGKPFPDLFLHAAAAMGVAPSATTVVEDSVPGVTAAVAAGMMVIGFARETPRAALAAAGAQVFDDMAALPGLLGLG